MVYDFVDSRHIQVGVVQDGSGCGSKELPGVYSRLDNPSVLNWILDVIRPFIFFIELLHFAIRPSSSFIEMLPFSIRPFGFSLKLLPFQITPSSFS